MTKRKKICIMLVMLLFSISSFIYSKYKSNFHEMLKINVRNPEYNVVFHNTLPSEYQEVEYIESDGTQYILTDIEPSANFRAVADLYLSTNSSSEFAFLGSRADDTKGIEYYFSGGVPRLWIINGSQGYTVSGNSSYYKKMLHYDASTTSSRITLELNSSETHSTGRGFAGTPRGLTIFAYNRYDGPQYHFIGRIYSLKLYDNNTLISDFVPCYRIDDDVAGLYDMVEGKFYADENGGNFDTGANVSNGYDDTKTQHFVYGTAQNLTANTYTRTGYTFNGWNTKVDGSGTSYSDEQNVNNLTSVDGDVVNLYAVWNPIETGSTVLYTDGTLIINEKSSDRAANITEHGAVTNEYAPLSAAYTYEFDGSNQPWYNERNSITNVEIGQRISPTSTNYWFSGLNYMTTGDFTNLDTSNVTSMNNMFSGAGSNSSVTTFTLTGLDNWDTSKVESMRYMFYSAGRYATTWSIGDLSGWDMSNVTNVSGMFYYAGYNASTSLQSIGTIKVFATNVSSMFYYSRYMKATVNIYSNPTSYSSAFSQAATVSGSGITVNYGCTTRNIDKILSSKGTYVVKGTLIEESCPTRTVNVVVDGGTADQASKTVTSMSDVSFNLTPSIANTVPFIMSCTNDQWDNGTNKGFATISNNVFTLTKVTADTTCNIKFYDDITVLYTDGTFIINEKLSDRAANITEHGAITNVYKPFSSTDNYVFSSNSNVLWYNERNSIKNVEIGQRISPTSTLYWFYGLNYMQAGDFTNLDTSNVTNMNYMFYNAGKNSTVNTFTLTGLDDWDTSNVTNMSYMFYSAGYNPTVKTFTLTGLDDWDTSNVTNMSYMFYSAGLYAKTWSIGNLSNWDTRKVTTMVSMMSYVGRGQPTSFQSIGTLKVYGTNIGNMFYGSSYIKATVNIYSNPTSYSNAFSSAAYQSGSGITVNYSSTTTNIDNILNNKGTYVTKGTLLD